jgi:hypothetical protein
LNYDDGAAAHGHCVHVVTGVDHVDGHRGSTESRRSRQPIYYLSNSCYCGSGRLHLLFVYAELTFDD